MKQQIVEMYNHLHDITEVTWEEKETTYFINEQLIQLGIDTHTFDSHTGVIGIWEDESSQSNHLQSR